MIQTWFLVIIIFMLFRKDQPHRILISLSIFEKNTFLWRSPAKTDFLHFFPVFFLLDLQKYIYRPNIKNPCSRFFLNYMNMLYFKNQVNSFKTVGGDRFLVLKNVISQKRAKRVKSLIFSKCSPAANFGPILTIFETQPPVIHIFHICFVIRKILVFCPCQNFRYGYQILDPSTFGNLNGTLWEFRSSRNFLHILPIDVPRV